MQPRNASGITLLSTMEVCPRCPLLHPEGEQGQQCDGDGKDHIESRER